MATHLSLAKVVTSNAKFILKTKNIFSKNPGVLQTRPCSEWLAPIHYLQTRCVRADEGRECVLFDECYFVSNVIIDHCFYDIWWLLKELFLFRGFLLTAPEVSSLHL